MADIEFLKKLLGTPHFISKDETITPELADVLRTGDRKLVSLLFDREPGYDTKYATFRMQMRCPRCRTIFEVANISKTTVLEQIYDETTNVCLNGTHYSYNGKKLCPACEQKYISALKEGKRKKIEEQRKRQSEQKELLQKELSSIIEKYRAPYDGSSELWPAAYEIMRKDFDKAFKNYAYLENDGWGGSDYKYKESFRKFGTGYGNDSLGYVIAGNHFDDVIEHACPISGDCGPEPALKRICLAENVLPYELSASDFVCVSESVLGKYRIFEIRELIEAKATNSSNTESEIDLGEFPFRRKSLYNYDEKLTFGKHRGETAIYVLNTDPNYCEWANCEFGFNVKLPNGTLMFD